LVSSSSSCSSSSVEMFGKRLIDWTDRVNDQGRILSQASADGKDNVVSELLATLKKENQADIQILNWRNPYEEGRSSLHRASFFDHVTTVKLLMQHPGVDVNARDDNGCSALWWACYYGCLDTLAFLLRDRRVDCVLSSFKSVTPLEVAILKDECDAVKLLLASRRKVAEFKTGVGDLRLYWRKQENSILMETILGKYMKEPVKTAREWQLELNFLPNSQVLASEIFSIIILHCDGYLKEKEVSSQENIHFKYGYERIDSECTLSQNRRRFFNIAAQFPIELQMVLSNRMVGLCNDFIASKIFEEALIATLSAYE